MATLEATPYGGWPHCVRLREGDLELVVTLDVGPRVIRLGRPGGQNLFKEFGDQLGRVSGDRWLSFGGHRLWHAPEVYPRTYAPDFSPVKHTWDGAVLRLEQATEPETRLRKDIEITPGAGGFHLVHRLTNLNPWAVEVAAWCLSVMAPGGRALLPQEPFRPHPDVLVPARPLVLWHFTRMDDPRFTWGDRLIQVREAPHPDSKQKIGVLNRQGWAGYELAGDLFLKTVASVAGATYPDMGCNCEIFTTPGFLEVETLSPLVKLEPGGTLEHVERWRVFHGVDLGREERTVIARLDPLLAEFGVPTLAG
jgi:hypothetical protein